MNRFVVALSLTLMTTMPSSSHEWYAPECCGGSDCAPADNVSEGPNGYGTQWGVVPYGDKRIHQSMDQRFHLCTYSKVAGPWSRVIPPYVRCLYVPFRGY